jgi:hypothetical protein
MYILNTSIVCSVALKTYRWYSMKFIDALLEIEELAIN